MDKVLIIKLITLVVDMNEKQAFWWWVKQM